MCKFCEGHEKLKTRADIYVDVESRIEIEPENLSPIIISAFGIDGGFFGYEVVTVEYPIKFCPYCGQSLEVEKNEFNEYIN